MQTDSPTLSTTWDRALVKRLAAAGISDEHARRMTAKLRGLARYPEIRKRTLLAKTWEQRTDTTRLKREGYADFTATLKPLIGPCLNAVQKIADERLAEGIDASHSAKDFLIELLRPSDFDRAPEVLDFILSDEVLAYATSYLGHIPVLQIVALSYTPANENMKKSQVFHFDNIDDSQLKFSMNVSDVKPENGPFTCLPAPVSQIIVGDWLEKEPTYKKGHRIPDEFIMERAPESDWIAATGGPGTIFAVDTCRCLHLGARTRKGHRITLRFNFTRRDCERMYGVNVSDRVLDRYRNDPVRALVLNSSAMTKRGRASS